MWGKKRGFGVIACNTCGSSASVGAVVTVNVPAQVFGKHAIAHERLAIIDPDSGSQPLVSPDGSGTNTQCSTKPHPPLHYLILPSPSPLQPRAVVVSANGEIYNYKELYQELGQDFYSPLTGSDCEVVIPLYLKYGKDFPNMLRGMFSFVVYDARDDRSVSSHVALASWTSHPSPPFFVLPAPASRRGDDFPGVLTHCQSSPHSPLSFTPPPPSLPSFFVLRDHMGITPLYIGHGPDGSTWFASELKVGKGPSRTPDSDSSECARFQGRRVPIGRLAYPRPPYLQGACSDLGMVPPGP